VLPPPPAARGGKGGGKGLIIGLGAVGVALLAAMAVVAAKSLKPDDDEPLVNPFASGAPTGAATIAPLIDAGDTTPVATQTATADSTATATSTTPTSRPTATTRPTATATATSTSTATPTATSTTKPSSGGAACDACIAAANSGDAVGAKANFDKCGDEAKKKECLRGVNRSAATLAGNMAKNGQCGPAKAIIAAAKQMGSTAKRLDTVLNDTSCK
jgi:septal ring-binding cell division protein DamX